MNARKKLNEEIKNAAPDLGEGISMQIDWDRVSVPRETKKRQLRRPLAFSLLATACLAAIAIPLFAVILRPSSPVPAFAAYDVVIDINPNISFTVGENGIITQQKGLNEDGVVFLHFRNYVGKNVDEATGSVLTELKNKGLISEGSVIRISAFDHATRQIKDDVQYKIEKNIENLIGFDVTTLFLSDDELDKIEDYYKSHTVNEDEKQLLENFRNKVLRVAGEKLADCKALLSALEKYPESETYVNLSAEDRETLISFLRKYRFEHDFDESAEISYDDLEDFLEELEDACEDLAEGIEEIGEHGDDYTELTEKLVDLIKDCLWDRD